MSNSKHEKISVPVEPPESGLPIIQVLEAKNQLKRKPRCRETRVQRTEVMVDALRLPRQKVLMITWRSSFIGSVLFALASGTNIEGIVGMP